MTPGVEQARAAGIRHQIHSYAHDPASAAYGLEAAERLGLLPARVFKTLVVELDTRRLVVAVIPVACSLDMKRLARAAGAKKAAMADKAEVMRCTGYVLGGVSPLGQKKRLPTYVDASACGFDTIYVSAGRRGLEIELAADDLCALTGADYAEICAG